MDTCCLIFLVAFILHGTNCENRLVRKKRETINEFTNIYCEDVLEKSFDHRKFESHNKINKAKLNFVLKTIGPKNKIKDTYIPITTPEKLLSNEKYKTDKPLVIFISGFKTNLREERSPPHDILANAYVKYRSSEVNFVTIDSGAYLDHGLSKYYKSAINTLRIGSYLAEALGVLIKNHPEIAGNLHLIGHSLGAQICGKIGRDLKNEGIKISRITGLDPASPCFYKRSVMTGLSTGDAKFVDIIHTNPGILGGKKPVGDVDFYPNGGRQVQNAPGCGLSFICSHSRAWEYYAESVVPGHEHDFLSCLSINGSKCKPQKKYPMGYAANHSYPKGVYILKTNEECPFGKNSILGPHFCTIFDSIESYFDALSDLVSDVL